MYSVGAVCKTLTAHRPEQSRGDAVASSKHQQELNTDRAVQCEVPAKEEAGAHNSGSFKRSSCEHNSRKEQDMVE